MLRSVPVAVVVAAAVTNKQQLALKSCASPPQAGYSKKGVALPVLLRALSHILKGILSS